MRGYLPLPCSILLFFPRLCLLVEQDRFLCLPQPAASDTHTDRLCCYYKRGLKIKKTKWTAKPPHSELWPLCCPSAAHLEKGSKTLQLCSHSSVLRITVFILLMFLPLGLHCSSTAVFSSSRHPLGSGASPKATCSHISFFGLWCLLLVYNLAGSRSEKEKETHHPEDLDCRWILQHIFQHQNCHT